MKQRYLGLALTLACACSTLTGCESFRHDTRRQSDIPLGSDDSEDAKPGAIKSAAPKGFFSNSRLSGAMSDEGREVERDLGIR